MTDPLNPTLFSLQREGMTIFISDIGGNGETFASVDFRPTKQALTRREIIAACSKHRSVDQKVVEQEVDSQLANVIYFDYIQEQKQKAAAKQADKDVKSSKPLNDKGSVAWAVASELLEENTFVTIAEGRSRDIYRYDPSQGIYMLDGESFMKSKIQATVPKEEVNSHLVNEAIAHVE
jgi:hypothetical protein